MRRIVVTPDAEGISRVESIEELGAKRLNKVSSLAPGGPVGLPSPRGSAAVADLDAPPGHAQWVIGVLPPDNEGPFHRTHSIDFVFIHSGDPVLVLRGEEVELGPGDCIVLNGVDHAWRTGGQGCTLSGVIHGIEPD